MYVNRCIKEQVFRRQLKLAKMMKLYKEDKKLPENYRLVGRLSSKKLFIKLVQFLKKIFFDN